MKFWILESIVIVIVIVFHILAGWKYVCDLAEAGKATLDKVSETAKLYKDKAAHSRRRSSTIWKHLVG